MNIGVTQLSEKNVLKCILQDPRLLYDIDREWLSPVARNIYDSVEKLYEDKNTITLENIAVLIESEDDYAEIVRDQLLNDDEQFALKDFTVYRNRLKTDYAKREIAYSVENILVKSKERGELNVDEMEMIQKNLNRNMELINGQETCLQTITEVGERYRKQLVARQQGLFYSYGDSALDKITIGAVPGQMTTIFGTSGMGKSAFSINLFNKQINKRIPAMYITLEMDETSTMDRLVALRCKIPVSDLMMRGSISDEGASMEGLQIIERFDEELVKLKKMQDTFFIVDQPSFKLSDLESMIAQAKKRMGTDYLICTIDLWTMISDVGTQASDIEDAINRTSAIAKRQNVHIINIVQANRDTDNKNIPSVDMINLLKPKTINSIKNSAAIGERSRTVLAVFRPKHYAEQMFPDDPLTNLMDDTFSVICLKASMSKIGREVKYLYRPEIFRLDIFDDDVVADDASDPNEL